MRVKSIQLENIRSHSKTEVPFMRGFNCLVGGLGRGKSSVLYAIDFVFFGDPLGRSYEYLLRQGAERGKVTSIFVHGGKTYTLQRALRRRGKSVSQDMEQLKLHENGNLIASAKNEAVAEQLKALTGLDKDLFREVVWVRQEHLKELLDVTPRQRQTKLDQLFGLSDYETAWSGLRVFQRDYKIEKDIIKEDPDVVGVEKLQTNYNKSVEEFLATGNRIQEMGEKLVQANSSLKEATSRLHGLEELRKKTEELRRIGIQMQTNIANIEKASTRLTDEIETKKGLINELGERLEAMKAQEKSQRDKLQSVGLGSDLTTEELRKHLSTIKRQMTSIAGKQAATKSEMETSQNRISNLTVENKCPLCLQDLTRDYKNGLLECLREENIERKRKLSVLQKNLNDLEGLYSVVELAVSNLQSLLPQIEGVERQLSLEQKSSEKLLKEFEVAQQQEKKLRSRLSATRIEITKFDVTELESARELRDNAFNTYSNIKNELELLERRKDDIALAMDNLKERLNYAQRKIERMGRIEKLIEIVDSIRGAYRSIQPKLRSEFVTYLQRTVQQQVDRLFGATEPTLIVKIDETYTPVVASEDGYEREVANLSGGERTLLAFAYRIGLGQLIMHSRTGHGLHMLLLDEPTESLGREDGSVNRLAHAISQLKAVEQIIAVTHSEAFAEKAEHVIRVEKEAGASKISAKQ